MIELPAPLVQASPWAVGLIGAAALAHALAKRVAKRGPPPGADCCAHEAKPCGGKKSGKKVD